MGIQNRDYYRSSGNAGRGWVGPASGRSMCQSLIIVTVVVFMLQSFVTVQRNYTVAEMIEAVPREYRSQLIDMARNGETRELQQLAKQFSAQPHHPVEEWGKLDRVKVGEGQIWRLLTYAFLHDRGGLYHILFNMLALYMFGSAVEELMGRREFLVFYLIAAIVAGLCHILFGVAMNDYAAAVGASGAVMAVTMLFAIHYPTAPINIYLIFTIEARWLIALYLLFDSLPILRALGGGNRSDGIAHAAHLGGLGFGYLYYRFQWRLSGWLSGRGSGGTIGQRLTRWWTRPRLRVYESPGDRPAERPAERPADRPVIRPSPVVSSRDLERRVDEILKKIKEEGEASLSDEERSILRDASQAYKRKNS